jgi:hypothetical protein
MNATVGFATPAAAFVGALTVTALSRPTAKLRTATLATESNFDLELNIEFIKHPTFHLICSSPHLEVLLGNLLLI